MGSRLGGLDGLIRKSGASSASEAAIAPVQGVTVSSLVLKNAPCNLYSAEILANATAGFLIAYNAVAAPASGAALATNLILGVTPVAANGYARLGGYFVPDRATVGCVLLFSTATATYTIPAATARYLKGQAV